MSVVPSQTLLQQLQWRYATKKFDSTKKISPADWETLEQALLLSPSSFGLQLWRFFAVKSPELRAKLRPASWGQSQVVDASHFVVLAVKRDIAAADVERHISRISEVRGVSPETLADYKARILGFMGDGTLNVQQWATRQVYISLGFFLSSAAMLGIDACPMEGFEPAQYDSILALPQKGYQAVVAVAAGYRASDDGFAKAKKVRFKKDDVVQEL